MTRRLFLGGLGAAALAAVPARARSAPDFRRIALRDAIDAREQGLLPGAVDDQSRELTRLIEKAAAADMPLFLPPGTYAVSNLTLPDNAR
ncbi:MAG TPA: TIGR03808 family TAT-translocated repetitive protein, partial [Pararhizobium sp.]|nr:TIGR03808 family TAT-translocated repetitive protein [Pararhizobium sp.]